MILYHAISSYQILCVMTHRLLFYSKEKAILILPDFILQKYPHYCKLIDFKLFDEIYLFPYLQIEHNKKTLLKDVKRAYETIIPYSIYMFDEIYVAGAHFYFTLYLIQKNVKFHFFEDAQGMLLKEKMLYSNLHKTFPIHAEVAKKHELFSGNHPLVSSIYCQKKNVNLKKEFREFQIYDWLILLKKKELKRVLGFFNVSVIKGKKKAVIFLTQQFSNLGIMEEEQQKVLVEEVVNNIAKEEKVFIKRHPDDSVDYRLSLNAIEICEVFPVELLPFVLKPCPEIIVTFSSTGIESIRKSFKYTFSFAEYFSAIYTYDDEFLSIFNIIKQLEREGKSYVQLFKEKK